MATTSVHQAVGHAACVHDHHGGQWRPRGRQAAPPRADTPGAVSPRVGQTSLVGNGNGGGITTVLLGTDPGKVQKTWLSPRSTHDSQSLPRWIPQTQPLQETHTASHIKILLDSHFTSNSSKFLKDLHSLPWFRVTMISRRSVSPRWNKVTEYGLAKNFFFFFF